MHALTTRLKKKRGVFLVEAMVSLTVITVGLLGLINLLSNSIGLQRVIQDQYVGSYLAAEGIEVVKNRIDSNIIRILAGTPGVFWNDGVVDGTWVVECTLDTNSCGDLLSFPLPSSFLKYDATTGIFSYNGGGTNSSYTRAITILRNPTGSNPDEVRVQSKVAWTTRGDAQPSITLEDHFYNWR